MSVLLDNLTAILVGSTLLVAMLVVQHRGQQSAVDATVRYQSQVYTAEFLSVLERDVENIRTMAEMEAAFGATQFVHRRQATAQGRTYTRQFAFPTLLDPDSGVASEVALVTYVVAPTGHAVWTPDGDLPTYQATRYVYTRGAAGHLVSGGSGPLVDFDVRLVDAAGATINDANIATTPPEVRLQVVAAARVPARRTGDQEATASTLTRHARTIRVLSAWATGGAPPVDTMAPAGIPPLPDSTSTLPQAR